MEAAEVFAMLEAFLSLPAETFLWRTAGLWFLCLQISHHRGSRLQLPLMLSRVKMYKQMLGKGAIFAIKKKDGSSY